MIRQLALKGIVVKIDKLKKFVFQFSRNMAAATVAKNLKVRRQTKALEEIFKKVNFDFFTRKNVKRFISKIFFSWSLFNSLFYHLFGVFCAHTKELSNIKRRHWDLYGKPAASIGLFKKLQNVVFSIIQKDLGPCSLYRP